jgi:hypothetical protein
MNGGGVSAKNAAAAAAKVSGGTRASLARPRARRADHDRGGAVPDNYLHDAESRAGRIQNYGAWSAGMVKPGTTCLGVECLCFRGDI